MSNYNRELSNLSYTNKDFGQIYPELLDLAKKISYKWDPSLSDESDPGVVLLKLAALMADKCNYNIDKNVLELFPLSVTQLANARQLFEQCGYTMRYYQSATTTLRFHMLSEPDLTDSDVAALVPASSSLTANDIKLNNLEYPRHYKIPRFTMFSDVDNSVVYTVTEDVDVLSDGSYVFVDAIQGAVKDYTVNGSTVVTANMLDSNNRIYFTELNVPENGIFISNVDSSNYWRCTDNLLLEELGTRCYKFGLSVDGSRCYIEFPTDIDTLIGQGINIKYVLTSGLDGNIRRQLIRQFFSSTRVARKVGSFMQEQSDIELTSENIYVVNEDPAQNGRNPETIDEAYRNYQKVKTTFNTLVSTRDYTNFLVTNKDLSNCVVCDRSDDMQSSYKILKVVDGIPQRIPHVRSKEVAHEVTLEDGSKGSYTTSEEEMTAFDLRVYGLKYVDGFTDYKSFSKSFDVVDSIGYDSIVYSTQDVKCLAHDYVPFEPDRIILLKNRYPIVAKIVSPYKLTFSQQDEIISRIKLDLFQLLNSQVIEFGQEIDYNLVYDTILNSDPRISAIILEEFKYETHAVYFSSSTNSIESMRIDAESSAPEDNNPETKRFLEELWRKFRTDVYARCVLSGNTPLYVQDSTFVYSLAHEQAKEGNITYAVEKMSTSVDIPLTYDSISKTLTSRLLKDNDVITLTSPNLIGDTPYSQYCQFVTNIGCTGGKGHPKYRDTRDREPVIKKGSDYMLSPEEYIIFFWRTTDDKREPYTYVKYTGRTNFADGIPVIISPSFDMYRQPHTDNMNGAEYSIDDDFFMKLGDTNNPLNYADGKVLTIPVHDTYSSYSILLNDLIGSYFIGENFNVKTQQIEPKRLNKIHLNNTDNGTNKFYWILNSSIDGKYRLFSGKDSEYTLQEGEQLIYSNSRGSQLYVLGAGTRIERSAHKDSRYWNVTWDCPVLDNTLAFLEEGPSYFTDSAHPWFDMSTVPEFQLYATEMQYRKLGAGTQLLIELPEDGKLSEDREYFITSEGIKSRLKSQPESSLTSYSEFQDWMCSYKVINELANTDDLPSRKHVNLRWEISSSLNLNMSKEEPQRLYSHQKILCLPEGKRDEESLWISVEGSDVEDIRIQSDRSVSRSGSKNIDVRYYDVLSEKSIPLNVYMYKIKDSDLSDDLPGNDYNIPWKFSTEEIVTSGYERELSNVSLPLGDYILPIDMTNLNYHTDVSWIELRKLSRSKLTQTELDLMKNLQTGNASADSDDDWHVARKPVELSDVVKWVYSSAYVDVSNEFKSHTVASAFNKLFVSTDPTVPDSKHKLRSSSDTFVDSDLAKMLIGYGGSLIENSKAVASLEHGDIICIRRESKNGTTFSERWNEVWIYNPNSGEHDYLQITSRDVDCRRSTTDDYTEATESTTVGNNVVSPLYYYILRPSNIASIIDEEAAARFNPCETITKNVPNKSGTYYFCIQSNGTNDLGTNSTYTLRIKTDKTRPTYGERSSISEVLPTYKIYPPVKYTRAKLDSSSEDSITFFEDVRNLVSEMDTQGLYDFTYSIPDEELVMYPLEAHSFLNPDHPMNKFTICEYTIQESGVLKKHPDLVVAGKSR